MSQNPVFDKLMRLLKELFQLDQPDLDFGLYRVMHARADEISQFVDRDLLPQVKVAFSQYKTADKAELEKELQQAIEQAKSLGVDPETPAKVKELRKKIAEQGVDVAGLEQEVYDCLYKFFRRYYHEGDFLAKRVYKAGVYAIPYEGEEVKLHWANKDQYYIKTSEYLRDYAFTLKPGADDPKRVHLRLVDAAEGEHGNVKEGEGKNRVFMLAGEDFIAEEDGRSGKELVIRFEYCPARLDDWSEEAKAKATAAAKKKPPTQKDLRDDAVRRVLEIQDESLKRWLAELAKNHVKASGESAEYNRLAAHLNRYTARNTFDYFIHKDLGGFLRQELDFYIKNEVMHLDDIESETAPRVEQYLSKIKVIRQIAGKIIDFLAQLENFQKKLWLKKKFVTETSWCIRIGCIPEDFYQEIVANVAQREEWVELHGIEKSDWTAVAYSEPLTIAFLTAHSTLMVDTRHFDESFTQRLLEAIGQIDHQTDGVLFHSENFQSLSAMEKKYRGKVQCIYIDPPYNTDASAIDYKNGYKASTWMSLLSDRIGLSRSSLTNGGVLIAAIDDEQQRELSFILSDKFEGNLLGTICVRANPSGRPMQTGYSVSHEYLLFAGSTAESSIHRMPPSDAQIARFSQRDEEGSFEWRNLRREGSNSDRAARPALYYPIYISGSSLRIPEMTWDDGDRRWVVAEDPTEGESAVWPDNEEGRQKTWRWDRHKVVSSMQRLAVRLDRSGRRYVYLKRRPHEDGVVSVSSWFDAKYSATEHGTALIKALFGENVFSYPKSIHAVHDAIFIGGAKDKSAVVLDFFAGSGTTGHAVINMNRADGGQRKFLMVEMGNYFDSVLLPRLKKVTFTPQWKAGNPERLATKEEADRSPRILKVVRLESYEDALNNLQTRRSETQIDLLGSQQAQGADGLREQYLLRYWLDVETRSSRSLLNVAAFTDPTTYRLKVKHPGGEESREVNVDLLETFNWLIGLTVETIAVPQTVGAQFTRDDDPDLPEQNPRRLLLDGRIRESEDGLWWFRTVTGATPDGRKTLVIWRKLTGDPEQDNLVLDEWFKKQGYSSKDSEFDLIYVNGDNNLENLRQPDDTWKVRLIEEDFHRLMFEEAVA